MMDSLEELEKDENHRAVSAEHGGWVSRRYGCKEPSTTVEWQSALRDTLATECVIDITDTKNRRAPATATKHQDAVDGRRPASGYGAQDVVELI